VREPATRAKLLDSGAEPVGNTAAEYAAFFKADVAKWARVVKDTGLTAK
jgi:tripartite-type tricarboxylate transporter receptor subunit TctC